MSWKFSEQHITKILVDFKLIISVYHVSFFEEVKIVINLIFKLVISVYYFSYFEQTEVTMKLTILAALLVVCVCHLQASPLADDSQEGPTRRGLFGGRYGGRGGRFGGRGGRFGGRGGRYGGTYFLLHCN